MLWCLWLSTTARFTRLEFLYWMFIVGCLNSACTADFANCCTYTRTQNAWLHGLSLGKAITYKNQTSFSIINHDINSCDGSDHSIKLAVLEFTISTQQVLYTFNLWRTLFSIVHQHGLHMLCWGVFWRAWQLQEATKVETLKVMASTRLLALALASKPFIESLLVGSFLSNTSYS